MDEQTKRPEEAVSPAFGKYAPERGNGSSPPASRAWQRDDWLAVPNRIFDETLPRLSGAATSALLALLGRSYSYDENGAPVLLGTWHRAEDLRPYTGLSRRGLLSATGVLTASDVFPGGAAPVKRKSSGRGYAYHLTDMARPTVQRRFTKLGRAICRMAAGATGKEKRSELRCLLVVVRRTVGFNEKSRIVTHRHFKAGSSIAHSETIGKATERLARERLVRRERRRPPKFDHPTYEYTLHSRLYPSDDESGCDREANRDNDSSSASKREANGPDREANGPDREANRDDDREANEVSERCAIGTSTNNRDAPCKGGSPKNDSFPSSEDEDVVEDRVNGKTPVAGEVPAPDENIRSREEEEEEPRLSKEKAFSALIEVGVERSCAEDLSKERSPERVFRVVDAYRNKPGANRPGWVVSALNEGWTFPDETGAGASENPMRNRPALEKKASPPREGRGGEEKGNKKSSPASPDEITAILNEEEPFS